jgi:hypothetical protein
MNLRQVHQAITLQCTGDGALWQVHNSVHLYKPEGRVRGQEEKYYARYEQRGSNERLFHRAMLY